MPRKVPTLVALVLGALVALVLGTGAIGQSTSTKPSVTYVANGQTVTGKVWDEDIGQLQVAPADGGAVSVIPRSSTVPPPTTTTTPPPTTTTPPPVDTSGRPYSADSPFNVPIPAGTATLPNSAALVAGAGWPGGGNQPYSMRSVNGTSADFSHPIYQAKDTDPSYRIACSSGGVNAFTIHIPAGARPTLSSDGHMSIVQTDGWEYDLWQTKAPSGGTVACNIGYRQRWDGKGIVTPAIKGNDSTLGANTAAFFGGAAGLVRGGELASGQINHALFLVIPSITKPYVYPAGHEASGNGTTSPHTGQRFRLTLTDAQIDASCAKGWEKTVAKAYAHYGAYVGDTGGGGFGFMFESQLTYTSVGLANPWPVVAAQNGISNDATYGYVFKPSGCINYRANTVAVVPPAQ